MAPRPSAFRAEIEVNGDVKAVDAILAVGKRAQETRPLMEAITGMLQSQQRARVNQSPYAPLEASTIDKKIRENEAPVILRDSSRRIKGVPTRVPDALYRAITVPNAPGQLRRITRASATFGVKSAGHGELFYARFVQNVKGKKRRILAISEGDALALVKVCASYVYDGWPKK